MNAGRLGTCGVAALLLCLAAAGCNTETKDYECEEAVEKMYDADCGLYCNYDTEYIYIDTCAWYDEDEGVFDESDAKDLCDVFGDAADDEDCEPELQDVFNCIVQHRDDDCADGCEDPYQEFMDCVF